MINYNLLKDFIKKTLINNYPINIKLNDIKNLSHFFILSNDWNKFLPFQIDIKGHIITGKYKNSKIIKVLTDKEYTWKEYLSLFISLLNKIYNPLINQNKFLCLLHTFNKINILNIKNFFIKYREDNIYIPITYIKSIDYNLIWNNEIYNKINEKDNHFYFESFDILNNKKNLRNELLRLFKDRDKFSSIHFHLDNNGGGDIVPAHLIIRCLIGKKEKWMRNITKILIDKTHLEWNCWNEENEDSPNYEIIKYLDLDFLPNYKTKYNGKIYLYMNKQNGSAAWFFITYLIYSFGKDIKRWSKKSYGEIIKFGTVSNDSQLVLIGHYGTTSGDGNTVSFNYNNLIIDCPTEQFIKCSIKKYDWNRFWINFC